MNLVLPTRLTVDEFLAWSLSQEKGRFELFEGRVVMQQPERWGHLQRKGQVFVALREAIARAQVAFFAAADGATVRQVVYAYYQAGDSHGNAPRK